MNFEDYDEYKNKKDIEEQSKKIFSDSYSKNRKYSLKVIIFTMSGCILFFLLMFGIMFLNGEPFDRDSIIAIITFVVVFVLIMIISIISIPKKPNYEKFKKRTSKYGYLNSFEMCCKIEELEKRVTELEREVNNLK